MFVTDFLPVMRGQGEQRGPCEQGQEWRAAAAEASRPPEDPLAMAERQPQVTAGGHSPQEPRDGSLPSEPGVFVGGQRGEFELGVF